MSTTRAVVFASRSFIGRAVCAHFEQLGIHTVRTARRGGDDGAIRCDLTDASAVAAVIASARPDWIVQCAGATRTDSASEMHELHVRGTSGLLSAVARLAPQARVLLFGSAAEYGRVPPEHLPITEQQPPRPVTAFGLSKLAQTELAAKFAQEHALRIVTIRPFNIVGAGLPEHFFAAALARRMLLHRATAAHGPVAVMNLEATRDFVDVRDAARAIAGLLSESSWRRGRMDIYNIASGSAVSLKEVAALLGRLAGGVGIENGGTAPSRSGIDRSCGDPARLYQAIRWTPRWSWQQSIIALWEELARTACCRGGAHELDPNSPQGEILAPQTGIARAG